MLRDNWILVLHFDATSRPSKREVKSAIDGHKSEWLRDERSSSGVKGLYARLRLSQIEKMEADLSDSETCARLVKEASRAIGSAVGSYVAFATEGQRAVVDAQVADLAKLATAELAKSCFGAKVTDDMVRNRLRERSVRIKRGEAAVGEGGAAHADATVAEAVAFYEKEVKTPPANANTFASADSHLALFCCDDVIKWACPSMGTKNVGAKKLIEAVEERCEDYRRGTVERTSAENLEAIVKNSIGTKEKLRDYRTYLTWHKTRAALQSMQRAAVLLHDGWLLPGAAEAAVKKLADIRGDEKEARMLVIGYCGQNDKVTLDANALTERSSGGASSSAGSTGSSSSREKRRNSSGPSSSAGASGASAKGRIDISRNTKVKCLDLYFESRCDDGVPRFWVEHANKRLEVDVDYTYSFLEYEGVEDEASIRIEGIGIYTGHYERTFKIRPSSKPKKKDISNAQVSGIREEYFYNGFSVRPEPTVVFDGDTLRKGVDFEVSYENNNEPGKASVVVTGAGDYKGVKEIGFKIVERKSDRAKGRRKQNEPLSLEKARVEIAEAYPYRGVAVKPDFVVKVRGRRLECGKDYSVGYSNNDRVGTGTARFEGRGAYQGTYTVQFAIRVFMSDCDVRLGYDSVAYDGKEHCPGVKVSSSAYNYSLDGKYSVEYPSNCTRPGRKRVLIAGNGDVLSGSATKKFEIQLTRSTVLRTLATVFSCIIAFLTGICLPLLSYAVIALACKSERGSKLKKSNKFGTWLLVVVLVAVFLNKHWVGF